MRYNYLKEFFSLVLILFTVQAFAQNYTDTRKDRESFKKLHPAEVRSEVAFFTFGGVTESARAPELPAITPTAISKDSIVIDGNGMYAKVKLAPFEPEKHKIYYDVDDKTPIKIDKKTYYGDYGRMPLTYIESIVLVVDGDTVAIPESAYRDLMNMKFTYVNNGQEMSKDAVFTSNKGRVYLYLFSNNRTGPYEVTYIIQDKKYQRRVLNYDLF